MPVMGNTESLIELYHSSFEPFDATLTFLTGTNDNIPNVTYSPNLSDEMLRIRCAFDEVVAGAEEWSIFTKHKARGCPVDCTSRV